MKWKPRPREFGPSKGDTRVVKKFLFFPLTLGGLLAGSVAETRWLEVAYVEQYYNVSGDSFLTYEVGWRNLRWAKESEMKAG